MNSENASGSMFPTLRARLKTETADEHRLIEELMYSDRIMDGQLSLEEYKHLLRTHFIFHEALEEAVAAQHGAFAGMAPRERQKAHLLREDLQRVDEPIPSSHDLFHGWSFGQLLGACYVAEGSTLGGAVIARALEKDPQLAAQMLPMRFYSAYGDRIGARWKEFLAFLEEHAGSHADAASDGALKAFRKLRELFQKMK